jgi:hypothetical protein
MLRTVLLSTLAAATLAGCTTGYTYRSGHGDYYYGQPRTEYRYYDPYGYYGGYYGYDRYAPRYYYDRYGRLVYGTPYGYYPAPYGYGRYGGHHPRPPYRPDSGDHAQDPDTQAHERHERKPPWRNLGGVLPNDERDERRPRMRRQQQPSAMPMPQHEQQRISAPAAPRMQREDGGGSRMGRAVDSAKASAPTEE